MAALFCLFGCAFGSNTSPGGSQVTVTANTGGSQPAALPVQDRNRFVTFPELDYPTIMYYGANLGYFPPYVRDWIMNVAFTKDKMEQPYMINPQLKVWWSEDNNAVLMEASYTVAERYTGAGTTTTWGQGANYSGSADIFKTYGEHAYYQTMRFQYEHKLYVERQLRTDRAFAEIVDFAKKLSAEIEYDWANFSGYRGARVRRTPGMRYAVCDGYSDEVMQKALALPSVRAVQKWTGPNHAWNVLKLVDGRTLFFDLTWFDNEHINHETGVVYETDDYGWMNVTFFEHMFRFSNIGYSSRQFAHDMGVFDREITKN